MCVCPRFRKARWRQVKALLMTGIQWLASSPIATISCRGCGTKSWRRTIKNTSHIRIVPASRPTGVFAGRRHFLTLPSFLVCTQTLSFSAELFSINPVERYPPYLHRPSVSFRFTIWWFARAVSFPVFFRDCFECFCLERCWCAESVWKLKRWPWRVPN